MKPVCLVLDHDDTIVNSTATIHYPAFVAFMKIHRPDIHLSLEDYFSLNFDPGVIPLFRDICGLNEEEILMEEQFWHNYVKDHISDVYEGLPEILWKHKKNGGLICVVSHSYSEFIQRDYAHGGLPAPDLIFGWDTEPEKRKPSPYSLYEIQKRFGLKPEQLLVLDDLKPGYDMARAAGVPFAAAGWANRIPEIETFMRSRSPLYFKTVREFGEWLETGTGDASQCPINQQDMF